jgi:Rrf2 family protein
MRHDEVLTGSTDHAKGEAVSGSELASAQNLPTRYLEPMLQKLVRAGILRGMRGPQGGYVLGRERRRISLADIYTALTASNSLPESTTTLGQKILTPATRHLLAGWNDELATITLDQLCERASAAQIQPNEQTTTTFMI